MEKTILQRIEGIYEASKDSQLSEIFLKSYEDDLDVLSELFNTNHIQSLFICIIARRYYFDAVSTHQYDIAKHIECGQVHIANYNEDFKNLLDRGILKCKFDSKLDEFYKVNQEYFISQKVIDAIIKNKNIPNLSKYHFKSVFNLLERINELILDRAAEIISTEQLLDEVESIIKNNEHLILIEALCLFNYMADVKLLFLYMAWVALARDYSNDIHFTLDGIYDKEIDKVNALQMLVNEKHPLIEDGFIYITKNNYEGYTELALTNFAINFLKKSDVNLYVNDKVKDILFLPTKLPKQELFFDKENEKTIKVLYQLLAEEKFEEVQKQLKEQNLFQGLTILLQGGSGSGKTELVKQIAKESQRELIIINLNNLANRWANNELWYLEDCFETYTDYSKGSQRLPILLIEHTEFFLSKSMEPMNLNHQSILLNELKKFKGILFISYNPIRELEPSLKHRFIYKIQLSTPSPTTQAKIWKAKLPQLNKEECHRLAQEFNFNGGQINNIRHKAEIQHILQGEFLNFDIIHTLCQEEVIFEKIPQKL